MRHQRRFISIVLIGAFAGAAGFAAAADDSNVFKADLSNPDLALAVNAFEQACLPFVLHKTEMMQAQNGQHHAKLMESRGFAFQSSETRSRRVSVEPGRQEWKPATQAINSGTFTVFNGLSSPVTQSTMAVINQTGINQTGEIDMRALVPPTLKTVSTQHLKYNLRHDPRLTANINWNYASQNHPGKSCEIRLDQPKIDAASFAAGFIDKDADWLLKNNGWTQCITDDEDQFRFEAFRTPQTLAISMIRNDFYTPNICGGQG